MGRKRIHFTEEERKLAKNKSDKKYRENNKEKIVISKKIYRENHKDKIMKDRMKYKNKRMNYDKKYRETHKEEIKTQQKNFIKKSDYYNLKKKKDINFKLACNLRTRLYVSLKNNQKVGSAVRDLGCSIPELKIYLESKFQDGMSWENWGVHGWHIDHIIPLDSFNLQNREEFLKACHYTNLQPLWANENIIKSGNL